MNPLYCYTLLTLEKRAFLIQALKFIFQPSEALHVATGQHNHFTTTPTTSPSWNTKEQTCISEPITRFPITIQLMRHIKALISAKPGSYHLTIIWTACCTAFFQFLHCGEFTSPSHSAYDPTVHLSFRNVAVNKRNSPSFIKLMVK